MSHFHSQPAPATHPASVQHLDQMQLAGRWQVSPRTLEQWRWQGRGPRFLKLGGRVVYPLSEVEAFEAGHLHSNTVAADPAQVSQGASYAAR
jgi:hypothetical protein